MGLVGFHVHAIRNVDVVYPRSITILVSVGKREFECFGDCAFGFMPCPSVKRAPGASWWRFAYVKRVLEKLGYGNGRLFRFSAVVVACEDYWRAGRGKFMHAADDEQHSLFSCEGTLVVCVGICEAESLPGVLVP